MVVENRLPALALPGLSPDSLGNYLASLGILRVLSRKWPSTRIAWRDGVLQVVGGPPTLDELLDELVRVAGTRGDSDVRKSEWTQYDKAWSDAQKKGTKLKSGAPLALWLAEAQETHLQLFAAHAVPHGRVSFNPLLGSGGNAGKRDFAKGWTAAVDALATARATADKDYRQATTLADDARRKAQATTDEKYQQATKKAEAGRQKARTEADNKKTEAARQKASATADEKYRQAKEKAEANHQKAIAEADQEFRQKTRAADETRTKFVDPREALRALLIGLSTDWAPEGFSGGSWFSEATKLYNSGQSPAREGQLSPWAMVLACEGLAFLAGGASRRLGARSRVIGAFPFVTQPIAASAEKEADRIRAEIWIPLWTRPMTLAEASSLFSRGRAELRGRGAITPAAFATAIRKRGVDAGVSEFLRFTLGRTTSSNTFEPRLEARFSRDTVGSGTGEASSLTVERVTALIEQRGFPRDGKRFVGLRGPIEAALLDVAAEPNRVDAAIALLDAITTALDRIDRNRGFREGKVRWEPLPLEWLRSLFADEQPGVEARLALSLVSSFPVAQPFATYRFGVELKFGLTYANYTHTERPPARWVWGPGDLARVLGAVLWRKLLDLQTEAHNPPRGRVHLPCTTAQVHQWLAGDIDESLFSAWLSRLALFDWRRVPQHIRSLIQPEINAPRVDGGLSLLGIMQPLVDQRVLTIQDLSQGDLLSDETGARTTEVARSLVALIRSGKVDAALRLASSRYAMAGAHLASFDAPFGTHDPDHLVAALLFTVSDRDRAVLFERWLRPRRRPQGGKAHV
jgi:CRISPR-associated protein Csx17